MRLFDLDILTTQIQNIDFYYFFKYTHYFLLFYSFYYTFSLTYPYFLAILFVNLSLIYTNPQFQIYLRFEKYILLTKHIKQMGVDQKISQF